MDWNGWPNASHLTLWQTGGWNLTIFIVNEGWIEDGGKVIRIMSSTCTRTEVVKCTRQMLPFRRGSKE